MKQWFFKITEYADELLDEIDSLDWPDKIKTMQKNWIGRSAGAEIDFPIARAEGQSSFEGPKTWASAPERPEKEALPSALRIKVFTTRPDTIKGATFLVVAPEYPGLEPLLTDDTREKVLDYKAKSLKKSEIERQENKEKTGVFTGSYAINPATKEKIPIWVADYVLAGYGTGAIMAVPAMDERDHEFAEAFDLPIVETELVDRDLYGTPKVTYKMRDWLISRQRYWGCPIPIAYDKDGNPHPIPEDQLPVLIPEIKDFKPDNSGHSALAKAKDWLKVTIDGEEMTRETDTLDGYACSSWYLWRYASPHDKKQAWNPKAIKYWEPVDIYVGADHAVAHLLYVRFWCKFFADEGFLPFREPIKKLIYHGYINAPDGKKMSKSKGNVIDPLDVINDGYGADTLRTYEMFIGPVELDAAWDPRSVGGVYRFLNRCWSLVFNTNANILSRGMRDDGSVRSEEPRDGGRDEASRESNISIRNRTIKKVTTDIYKNQFNTAVAALMEYVNELYKQGACKEDLVVLAKLLKPFAPHLASEMLEKLGTNDEWPKWDEKYLTSDTVEIIVQVNGKLRAKLRVEAADIEDEEKITELAKNDEKVAKFIKNGIKKTIYVKKAHLLNIVA